MRFRSWIRFEVVEQAAPRSAAAEERGCADPLVGPRVPRYLVETFEITVSVQHASRARLRILHKPLKARRRFRLGKPSLFSLSLVHRIPQLAIGSARAILQLAVQHLCRNGADVFAHEQIPRRQGHREVLAFLGTSFMDGQIRGFTAA